MQRIETTGLPPDGRARYWREEVGSFVGMPFDIEARPPRPFEMHSICTKIDSVVVGEVWGDAHKLSQVSRLPQDVDVCVIVIPRASTGSIVQAGHQCRLSVDHAYLLDNRSQWTMIEHQRFRRLFLGVRRADVSSLRNGAPSPFIERHTPTVALIELVKSLVEPRLPIEELRETTQKALSRTLCDLVDSALDHATHVDRSCALHAATRELYHRHRVRDYVLAHLPDPHLSVASVASAVGVSTRHLHRLYAHEAIPIGKLIWSERLDRCHRELTGGEGGRPIAAIAHAWGFRDVAHFSRAFRSKYGVTPSGARRADGDGRSPRG